MSSKVEIKADLGDQEALIYYLEDKRPMSSFGGTSGKPFTEFPSYGENNEYQIEIREDKNKIKLKSDGLYEIDEKVLSYLEDPLWLDIYKIELVDSFEYRREVEEVLVKDEYINEIYGLLQGKKEGKLTRGGGGKLRLTLEGSISVDDFPELLDIVEEMKYKAMGTARARELKS